KEMIWKILGFNDEKRLINNIQNHRQVIFVSKTDDDTIPNELAQTPDVDDSIVDSNEISIAEFSKSNEIKDD
ncbi:24389_t:CDS:1, partial [Gigaspora margarita]